MAFTTKGMGTGRIDISLHRKIGEAFTEAEIIIKTAVKNNAFDPVQRTQLKRKLGTVAGAIRVYMVDAKKDLTSAQIADLQLFQNNVQAFATKASIENEPGKLLPQLQALRVELDDLLG